MNSKSEQTTGGHEPGAEKLVIKRVRIGVCDFPAGASVALTNFVQPRFCSDLTLLYPNTTASLLDASGFGTTDATGKLVFLLSELACYSGSLADPINVVATARTTRPVFVTVEHALTPHPADLQITVMAWDAQGVPAPGVLFDWRCRSIHLPTIIGPK